MLERLKNTIEIVRFAPGDLEACLGVWEAAIAGPYAFLSGEAVRHQRQVVARLADVDTFVARVGAKIVGFVSYTGTSLLGLFVNPAYQRQGVGHELVERIGRPSEGLSVVVYQENTNAFAFFRKLGFAVIKARYLDGGEFPYPIFQMRQSGVDV